MKWYCIECGHVWDGLPREERCPECGTKDITLGEPPEDFGSPPFEYMDTRFMFPSLRGGS